VDYSQLQLYGRYKMKTVDHWYIWYQILQHPRFDLNFKEN